MDKPITYQDIEKAVAFFRENGINMKDAIVINQEMNPVTELQKIDNAPSRSSEMRHRKEGRIEGLLLAKARIDKINHVRSMNTLMTTDYAQALDDVMREIDAQLKIHQETR